MILNVPRNWKKLQAAMDLAKRAAALYPNIVENWETLGDLLLTFQQGDEAVRVFEKALSFLPDEPRLHLHLADAYRQTERRDVALEIVERSPSIREGDLRTIVYRAELRMMLGDLAAGAPIARETLAIDPTNHEAIDLLAKSSRRNGEPEAIIPFCKAALRHDPGHGLARYRLAVALALIGRSREACELIDVDRFTTVIQLPRPTTYSSAKAFESALADEILDDPTLAPDPPHKATRGGLQSFSFLPHTTNGAIATLLDQIRSAVLANLPDPSKDSFFRARPEVAELDAWAVVYQAEGRQTSHIHPSGWLSGVYYVSASEKSGTGSRAGCLSLGDLEVDGSSVAAPWGKRNIQAVAGRLVLFPSYVPHATIPTMSADTRICVSFDVIPLRRGQNDLAASKVAST